VNKQPLPEFIDLSQDLQSAALKWPQLSPHVLAAAFAVTEGIARGGFEIIVAQDRQGKFVGAGTANVEDGTPFPPSLEAQLKDRSSRLVVHHNHPPGQEPFFSDRDMGALADNPGIEWLLMHNANAYSAIRASDHLFVPDKRGITPVQGLVSALKASQLNAQLPLARGYPDLDVLFRQTISTELSLQALQQVGAITHYTSFKTGLGPDVEQDLVDRIKRGAWNLPDRAGGSAIWGTPLAAGTSAAQQLTLQTSFQKFEEILAHPVTKGATRPGPAARPGSSSLDHG
jgi:hypothetical protein